jgi:uncharacterized protein (DUF302 family)
VLAQLLPATAVGVSPPGVAQIRSRHTVVETVNRLSDIVREHGLTVFARIDFCADARSAGLAMRPEQLLLFGNPRGGTPLMVAAATAGLDLPVHALVWEDATGTTWIAWNSSDYVLSRHGIPPALAKSIEGAVALIARAAN